jgi:polyhydroxyalkanoate synthase subunit PhaC
VVDFVRRKTNMEKINLMGICMGGTFSVMYAALHPGQS